MSQENSVADGEADSKPRAIVIGAAGGIGSALVSGLIESGEYSEVVPLHRGSQPPIDLLREATVAEAAQAVMSCSENAPLRMLIVATGFLHGSAANSARSQPERGWRDLDPHYLQQCFAINAVGPALILKHFAPLLAREGRCCIAALSARVGSIEDNRLGGWYGYRASKAALNQIIRTAAIELKRRNPASVCVAIHPGTVATALSAPFAKTGLNVRTAATAAEYILKTLQALSPAQAGGFFDYQGLEIPW